MEYGSYATPEVHLPRSLLWLVANLAVVAAVTRKVTINESDGMRKKSYLLQLSMKLNQTINVGSWHEGECKTKVKRMHTQTPCEINNRES